MPPHWNGMLWAQCLGRRLQLELSRGADTTSGEFRMSISMIYENGLCMPHFAAVNSDGQILINLFKINLQSLCKKIRSGLPEEKLDELWIRKDIVTGKPEVQCFLDDMDLFLQVSWCTHQPHVFCSPVLLTEQYFQNALMQLYECEQHCNFFGEGFHILV